MTDTLVAEAALMYIDGHSLKAVADEFNVDTRTLRREFRKAVIPIRRGEDGSPDIPVDLLTRSLDQAEIDTPRRATDRRLCAHYRALADPCAADMRPEPAL